MKRLVWVFASVAVAWSLVGAGAYFTDRAEVPDNVVRAGEVSVSTEPTSAALSVVGLAPGATIDRSVSVVNDGDLTENVVLSCAKKAGITDFYNALTCRVIADGIAVYDGPLKALKTTPFTIKPGERVSVIVAVSLPAQSGNDLAGAYVRTTLYVDAEQVR